MKNTNYHNHHIDYGSFVLGVLFIITALISFANPAESLLLVVVYFAIFAIIKGIFEIFVKNKIQQLTGYRAYSFTIVGVLNLIIGAYLLFNLNIGLTVLPFVFSIWFLIDSVAVLLTLDLAKVVSKEYFWFTLITGVIGIIVGLVLLFNPLSSALTVSFLVGFYFMLFGINYIVYAFR